MPPSNNIDMTITIHDESAYYLFLQAILDWSKEMEQRTVPLSPAESALLVAANNFSAAEAHALEQILIDEMKRQTPLRGSH